MPAPSRWSAPSASRSYHPPIVGVGPHSGDPHYAPGPNSDGPIREGDFVLIDLWAKLDKPRSVYSDLTWTGFAGTEVPEKYERIFQIVARARDAAINKVRSAFPPPHPPQNGGSEGLRGWEV